MLNKKISILIEVTFFLGLSVVVVEANHSWGKYHWDLSTADTEVNPLKIGNNLTAVWASSLTGASADWNFSVLKNEIVGGGSDANCSPTSGRVEVCNAEYGDNNWLGIAQIWAYRGKDGHIAQGVVKLNDTYFNTSKYDTQAWRNFVMCQEIGHEFGLDHQDVTFSNTNLGTCMDYTSDPDGTVFTQFDNTHPNQHDLDEMTAIYAHLNGTTDGGSGGSGPGSGNGKKPKKVGAGADIDLNDPSSWGQAIKQDAQGKNSLFRKDLGNGQVVITHVFWTE